MIANVNHNIVKAYNNDLSRHTESLLKIAVSSASVVYWSNLTSRLVSDKWTAADTAWSIAEFNAIEDQLLTASLTTEKNLRLPSNFVGLTAVEGT